MKQFKSNKLAASLAGGCLLSLVMAAQSAVACTVDNWTGNSNTVTPGSVVAASPATVSRYSGLCGMKTAAATTAWVQDDSPAGINRIRARFYVLNELNPAAIAPVYSGFSTANGSGPLFTVFLTGAGEVRLRDIATGTVITQSAGTKWLSVEIDWSQGSGDGVVSLSVNGQAPAPVSNLNNAGSALQSVRLGNLSGAGGTLSFDAYESRRTTEIGRLVVADSNNDGSINGLDIVTTRNEVLGGPLSGGQPDCTEDGLVNGTDIVCTRIIALGG